MKTCGSEAEDGQLAYYAYSKLKPDIVTMDIAMPVMDGVQTAQKILAEKVRSVINDTLKLT